MTSNKLNEVQLHLLKMFSVTIDDNILNEIKKMLSDYFYQKVVNMADSEWEKREYNNEIMDEWIYSEIQ